MSETVLGFDVGARRIGVAVGNDLLRQARPAGIVKADVADAGFGAIARIVDEWQPDRLVIGWPLALEHEDAMPRKPRPALRRCANFAEQLETRFGLPIERVDERYSSLDADELHRDRRHAGLARRATALDDVAAEVILQRYFDALPANEGAA